MTPGLHLLLLSALVFLARPTWGAVPECIQVLINQGLRFSDAFDQYSAGQIPSEAFLLSGKFRLTGVFTPRAEGIGIGTHYDSTGYQIEDQVPQLQVLTRAQLDSSTASYATQDLYVTVSRWGAGGGHPFPTAIVSTDTWEGGQPLKRTARFFELPLFGEEADLFARPNSQARGEFAQLYCRELEPVLICMVEYFRHHGTEIRAERIEAFLIFERQ